jgi:DNA-binding transcriptional ArsR family regulator
MYRVYLWQAVFQPDSGHGPVLTLPAEEKALDGKLSSYYYPVMELSGNANASSQRLDATFAALADPTRRAILARLASGEASVAELSAPFAMSQPAISKHLKVLEGAGLIVREREAQRRPSRLNANPLAEATQWLADYRQFWKSSFHKLDDMLDDLKTKKKKGKKRKHKKH